MASTVSVKNETATRRFISDVLFTGRNLPFRPVRLALEMRAPRVSGVEILRILDDGGHDQIRVAVRFVDPAEILGDHGVGAVWDAVALQVARTHARRDDLQLSLGHRTAFSRTSATRVIPRGNRHALQ